ncbi:MobA/MobL family protein [Breoghania corrubedonensis]|uniref:MobA/MobL family protein n=1 Tax=Breoghania corrubedonensis TaxID=665038 RepID=A0A2T5VD69_9HYPH|nr:MobA/MobL family protein [Breoghania corrubedonensis]PTW61691.1 MobA/MobL family protein [Breoghania corrubedonensis]
MQDGNVHCHVDNLSRQNGKGGERIAIATAAYNAGERLWSERQQRFVDFGNREDVIFEKIILPKGAPPWAGRRSDLWNRVDLAAKRRDARLAKSIEAAITRDVPATMRPALLEAFVAPFVALGCIADVAIHEDGTENNPHVHILLTTRVLELEGFGPKLTALEQRAFVKQVRKRWADLTNSFLEKAGSTLRVDHRSYKARGIGAEPTQHRGPNTAERRIKREHARRVRQEKIMAGPDTQDRHHYPLLTQRETWPPEPAASPDMSPQEREELHRYWEDKKLDRLEAVSLAEPKGDREAHREHDTRAPLQEPSSTPWFEQALDNAHRQKAERLRSANEPTRLAVYESFLLERAERLPVSREEQAALDAAREASPELHRLASELILDERLRVVRERDRAEKLRRLPSELRQKLEAIRPDVADREEDYPVPGPDGELRSPRELDIAYERMLDEYLREEPDREQER